MNSSLADDFYLDVEPRARCLTWPMNHNQMMLDEENEMDDGISSLGGSINYHPATPLSVYTPSLEMLGYTSSHHSINTSSIHGGNSTNSNECLSNGSLISNSLHTLSSLHDGIKKKRNRKRNPDTVSQKKPNPWGEDSYSDLIAKALDGAIERRMKLNEIYLWFSENIPYFRDRSTQEEAAGWKNSIRHNLSLHNRFMRIQNEGAGKSSWWVINPDANKGRTQRRQRDRSNTLDSTRTAAAIGKKTRGAKKKVEHMGGMRNGSSQGYLGNSTYSSTATSIGQDMYGQDPEDLIDPAFGSFRTRTASNISGLGESNVSPTLEAGYDEYEQSYQWGEVTSANDLLDRTSGIQLVDTMADHNNYRMGMPSNMINGGMKPIKQDMNIKQEIGVQPPPAYVDLNSVQRNGQMQNQQQQQNTMMRGPMNGQMGKGSPNSMQMNGVGTNPMSPNSQNIYYQQQPPQHNIYGVPMVSHNGQQQMWSNSPMAQPPPAQHQMNLGMNGGMSHSNHMMQNNMMHSSCGAQSGELPTDLRNLSLPDCTSMMECDVEAMLRHELSVNNQPLNFDL
uniref:Fork-head domain-containing protein n=1 Tax=Rhabditophanes sp. KR3021 TaxID=114890 RepID=A0AC35TFP3_9BILA